MSSFFIQSVNSIVKTVQNQFISGTNYGSDSDQSPMFDATVKQTFYFVNSGSLDGTMENGEKLDEAKLLQVPNLSKEEKETFKKIENNISIHLKKKILILLKMGQRQWKKALRFG